MMRALLPLSLMALLMLGAPLGAAQEETNETRPDDAAWVEDCPPDMMCAAGANETAEEPTYSGDCGGEVCAYGESECIECSGPADEEPVPYGDEECIDCSGPVDNGGTCMDGAQEGETCRDDVHYMDAPTRGPEDGSCENCRGEETGDAGAPLESDPVTSHADAQPQTTNTVPAPALVGVVLAAAGVALLVARRR